MFSTCIGILECAMQEKNLFGPSFEEKVRKTNEMVKILSKAAPRKSNTHFFRRGTSSQFRPEAHISEAGAGAGGNSRLLNQVRTLFHPKVSSGSRKPVKHRSKSQVAK
ncbi:uncharacterized protein [Montipora capricornis]|uniref:uncharacterized protein n=1 Tax=Montipora capricornis TaxID=246305 RepID=UPI0035F11CEC